VDKAGPHKATAFLARTCTRIVVTVTVGSRLAQPSCFLHFLCHFRDSFVALICALPRQPRRPLFAGPTSARPA
jgi:hypothetical protein